MILLKGLELEITQKDPRKSEAISNVIFHRQRWDRTSNNREKEFSDRCSSLVKTVFTFQWVHWFGLDDLYFAFVSAFELISCLLNEFGMGNKTLTEAIHRAYDQSLKHYHGFFARSVFSVGIDTSSFTVRKIEDIFLIVDCTSCCSTWKWVSLFVSYWSSWCIGSDVSSSSKSIIQSIDY